MKMLPENGVCMVAASASEWIRNRRSACWRSPLRSIGGFYLSGTKPVLPFGLRGSASIS
jgi:hypothetical protein